jgi:carboxymethylenebutenolidase
MHAQFVELGGDLRAYFAVPGGAGPFPGVLLYQEAFGVNDYIQSEVRRLADRGYAAVAPDFFRGETFNEDQFDKIRPKLSSLTRDGLLADVDAAIGFLKSQASVRPGPFGAVGFCMGGRVAVMSALYRPDDVSVAVSWYGGGIAPATPKYFAPLIDDLALLRGELLLIYGADDEGIAPDEHGRIAEALSKGKKNYALRVYPGAGHGFGSRDRASYRPVQAEAAWVQTLATFDRVLRAEA